MDYRRIFSLAICCSLLLLTLISGCTSNNYQQETSTGLSSNGKNIDVTLKKASVDGRVYEFIFEVRNLENTGITIYHPFDPNGEKAHYNVWIEDYGNFKHDVMVYGEYEQLDDGSYRNNQKNVVGAMLKLYPKEKILIGCTFLPKKTDIEKLRVKTNLYFSFGDGNQRVWDITYLFKN